jgi:pyruvate/2-oxoglutarate dehydrogenase complex dihydrolipoamide acyltransferase (E2) component
MLDEEPEASSSEYEDEEEQEQDQEPYQPQVVSIPTRRQPVKDGGYHDPPCDRCSRGRRWCYKEAGGGACFDCVKMKCRCEYSKGGLYTNEEGIEMEGEDDEPSAGPAILAAAKKETKRAGEKKGKGKGKARAEPKAKKIAKEFDEDAQGVKERWVDVSDDEPAKTQKKPARPRGHAKQAAAAAVQPDPGVQGTSTCDSLFLLLTSA